MREFLNNCLLVLASTLLTLLLLELGIRVWMSDFALTNLRQQKVDMFRSAYPAAHDPELGWLPKAGTAGKQNIWHTQVTILDHGIRANGPGDTLPGSADPPPVLAVGDSFVFGDQVSDGESWPAQLEALAGVPVVNGGVFGYGIDQSYLRARRLIDLFHPQALVFGFIAEDIERCQTSVRNAAAKPYFAPEEDRLVLKNVPTPPPIGRDLGPASWKDVLGHSYLVHKLIMKSAFRRDWLQGDWGQSVTAHRQGLEVACRLLQATEALAAEKGIRLYVLLQYTRGDVDDPAVEQAFGHLRACLKSDTAVVDLKPILEAERAREASKYGRLFKGHMTAAGNRLVAETLWRVIGRRAGSPPGAP